MKMICYQQLLTHKNYTVHLRKWYSATPLTKRTDCKWAIHWNDIVHDIYPDYDATSGHRTCLCTMTMRCTTSLAVRRILWSSVLTIRSVRILCSSCAKSCVCSSSRRNRGWIAAGVGSAAHLLNEWPALKGTVGICHSLAVFTAINHEMTGRSEYTLWQTTGISKRDYSTRYHRYHRYNYQVQKVHL